MHEQLCFGGSLFGPSGNRKYLNAAERRRFFESAEGLPPAARLFCLVLAFSGGRVSEVLALTPAAIDIESGVAGIQTLKRRKRGVVRQVPLPPDLLGDLDRFFGLAEMQRDPDLSCMRFWTFSRTTAWRLVKAVMATAGIVGMPAMPKGLRHGFGVNAFQSNVPPHLVQRWLGHASLRTTAIYADVIGSEERAFAARMWSSASGDGASQMRACPTAPPFASHRSSSRKPHSHRNE
ncbi:tyrosine-type recombinase/integrase [Bradyrhizobium genosp. A]|uniref:tyrosine-type recombinase/integrase n=1 Tax=Bradyrhizobium genosp. A TaxID=83626 RepID=UPI003CEBE9B2